MFLTDSHTASGSVLPLWALTLSRLRTSASVSPCVLLSERAIRLPEQPFFVFYTHALPSLHCSFTRVDLQSLSGTLRTLVILFPPVHFILSHIFPKRPSRDIHTVGFRNDPGLLHAVRTCSASLTASVVSAIKQEAFLSSGRV